MEESSANGSVVNSDFDNSTDIAGLIYRIITPTMFGLITLTGTMGNCLVIYVIISRKKMRTVTNILLLNLAFADMFFLVICPPFTAYAFVVANWAFGDVGCRLMHYMINVTAYVTVYTLVLIAVTRYLTVVHHAETIKLRTKKNIVIMIFCIWLVFLSLNVPVLLSYHVVTKTTNDTNSTVVYDCDLINPSSGGTIFATFFAFAYVIPLALVALFSILILHHIQSARSSMISKKSKSSSRKNTASRVIILVVALFAILWLPVHIHLLVAFFGDLPQNVVYQYITLLWNCMAYFNSCVNPIIYNYASKDFRDNFREVICCKWSKRESLGNGTTMMTRVDMATQASANGRENQTLLVAKEKNGGGGENVESTAV